MTSSTREGYYYELKAKDIFLRGNNVVRVNTVADGKVEGTYLDYPGHFDDYDLKYYNTEKIKIVEPKFHVSNLVSITQDYFYLGNGDKIGAKDGYTESFLNEVCRWIKENKAGTYNNLVVTYFKLNDKAYIFSFRIQAGV